MKNIFERDKNKRNSFLKKEFYKAALQFIRSKEELPLGVRWSAGVKLSNLSRKGNLCNIKNRCTETFRGRSVMKNFRMSRIIFRDFARFGQILGVTKKSW